MAHFARLDENNVVIDILAIADEDCVDENGVEQESIGIEFCKALLGEDTNWVQTSYNHNIRAKHAGVGDIYHPDIDEFRPEQPFPSWAFDYDVRDWMPPIPFPTGTIPIDEMGRQTHYWSWNEDAYQADNTQGWELLESNN
jgi:hypothetical protein